MKYETVHAIRKREEAMRRADGLSGTAPAQKQSEPAKEEGEKDE